ncbi:S9 family peptidase [Arenibacter sp. ARW7G5Y1]|uniref:alpha/beta hydrolase family protein n=1 Tax=Arenibacter sp. ARW7G5Y1 TaxID=2135619 RepID=UPI000D757D62|nr:alpha/beta hydrolase family protein [Arenibacter sp. ARW7G5Y1]PXX31829.1 acetyl xylan esterase AXE1 [Arenibacter sp. ARW7G5Y1]
MGKVKLLVCIFILGNAVVFSQVSDFKVAPNFDQTNNIRCYLSNVASGITQNALKDIHNLTDWEKVREERYEQFCEMMGLQGKQLSGNRPALKITKTGVIQKEGYRIEKLYYESLPGLYVPANLYIPDGIKKPVPAILYVCGHSHTQKHHYQAHAKNFAQNGFVCLIIETIQRGEVKGEHLGQESNGWFQWYSKGYNPGGVEIWNGIRGLDLLSKMPEVDKDKLGVTGISGGGSQSWYLPAIDRRVKAAAAVAGAGSLEGQITQKTIDDHCDCMMPINTYGIDFSDIGALIAPRPFMIAQTNRDLYYSLESVHTLFEKIKPIYSFYGKSDNLIMKEASGPHSYGSNEELRPEILSFFLKELSGINKSVEQIGEIDITKELSNDALKAYTISGPPKDDRTTTIQDSFVELASPPSIGNMAEFTNYKREVVTFLKKKTFGAFPKQPVPLDIRSEFRALDGSGTQRQDYSFVPEEGWRLKFSLRGRNLYDSIPSRPLLLVLRNPDEERWSSESMIAGALKDMEVAYFEARGIGETGWSPSLQWHIRRSAAWTGRTIASMRVYDVLRCLQALREIPGINTKTIHIAAQGEMAVVAAYAALLDGNVKTLLLKDPPATQNVVSDPSGRGEALEMLNSLRVTDIPQVVGLNFPNELVMVGNPSSTFEWTKNLYSNLKMPDAYLQVDKISQWVNK